MEVYKTIEDERNDLNKKSFPLTRTNPLSECPKARFIISSFASSSERERIITLNQKYLIKKVNKD